MAGAGLMAAVMTFSSKEYSTRDECLMVESQKMISELQRNYGNDFSNKARAQLVYEFCYGLFLGKGL